VRRNRIQTNAIKKTRRKRLLKLGGTICPRPKTKNVKKIHGKYGKRGKIKHPEMPSTHVVRRKKRGGEKRARRWLVTAKNPVGRNQGKHAEKNRTANELRSRAHENKNLGRGKKVFYY